MGVSASQGKGRFGGRTPSLIVQLQIAAKPSVLCCHLVNKNEVVGGLTTVIPHFAKLLWSLLLLRTVNIGYVVACMFDRVEWPKLQPLIAQKLELVVGGFEKMSPGTDSVAGVNSDCVSFDEMQSRLVNSVNKFNR